MDIVAVSREFDDFEKKVTYNTGLAIEIPEGYVGLIFPRSSIHKYDLTLTNSVGVIDSGYRGEIKIIYRLTDKYINANIYDIGDRVAQLIILPYPHVTFNLSKTLTATERGNGGFGSSGR